MRNKFLLAASSVLTALAGLAFVNNVVVVARWWAAFSAAGGDSTKIPAKCAGFIPWLDWTAVDYSTVTTLVPFLGLLCVTVGLVKIVRRRVVDPAHFPFFASADQLNVAFGLFGTLWGIIVIGYFRIDTVSMADLMQCLHTALYSTLAAVVWVFMIDHPILRPAMGRLLAREGLAAGAGSDASLDAVLADLRAAATGLGETWRAGRADVESFRAALGPAAADLASFAKSCDSSAAAIDAHLAALDKATAATAAAFDQRLSAFEKAAAEGLATLEKGTAARLDALEKRDNDVANTLQQLYMAVEAMRGRANEDAKRADAAAQAHAADLQRLHTILEQLLHEKADADAGLKTAQAESAAATKRADDAEGRLAKIRSTFNS